MVPAPALLLSFTVHRVIVQGWPWNTLVATQLSIAAPRADGSIYRNEAMQFLRLRWGKVVEDHLHEDTYKLVIELQKRLSNEETGERLYFASTGHPSEKLDVF